MKYVVRLFFVLAVIAGAGFGYLKTRKPAMRPAPDIKIERTSQRVERGRYLFESVLDCAGCHSPRNMAVYTAPVIEGRVGSGFSFPRELGLPGDVVAPNVTSDPETGIGQWTDGEIIRAIREGVSRDGSPLFSFMPYQAFARMSDEDTYSLVAYLRSLPPVRSTLPRTKLDFPASLLASFDPMPVPGPVSAPDPADRVKHGEYLVTIAVCGACHTKMDKGKPIQGMEFAGGEEFRLAGYLVRSANITPDEETGIGKWSEDRFLAKFKGHANMTPDKAPAHNQTNFTLMPWMEFAKMTDDDLKSIYAYLRTLKPIHNSVEVHPPVAN
jgi:mono/diheme cytochrome c family protein